MAFTEPYAASATITTTEWDMVSNTSMAGDAATDVGVFVLVMDLANLAVGDEFQVRVYEKATSGGTQRVAFSWGFVGPQSSPLAVSVPLHLRNGWAMTVQKIAGTDRTIAWSIRKIG